MKTVDRLKSCKSGKIIDVVRDTDGTFLLHEYESKYDAEEETTYEVRVHPDPGGRYGSIEMAIAEANRILSSI